MTDSGGLYQFMIDSFMPLAIMAVFGLVWLAWSLRLAIYFWRRFFDTYTLQRRMMFMPVPHGKSAQERRRNPHSQETMGLPKGVIRTFLVLVFSSIAVIAITSGNRLVLDADKKWILGELGVMITFYFGNRALEARTTAQAKEKAIALAKNVDEAMKVINDRAGGDEPESSTPGEAENP